MKVLIAPASFKGSLSAAEAAAAIDAGFQTYPFETRCQPLADGGEGTLEILLAALDGQRVVAEVTDPLGRSCKATYGLVHGRSVALVESARIIGLDRLSPSERKAGNTTSFGLGTLIRKLLDEGKSELWISLGGSATVDAGIGMLAALGARFPDEDLQSIPLTGFGLERLAHVDLSGLHPGLKSWRCRVLCDVRSPLLGSHGAALYMAQKGADRHDRTRLRRGLRTFEKAVARATGISLGSLTHGGAAGGLGAALALLGGELVDGAAWVLDATGFETHLAWADLVVSGEGRIDEQTVEGKVLSVLAARCKPLHKPLIAFCGTRGKGASAMVERGVTSMIPIVPGPMSESAATARAAELLRESAAELARLLAGVGASRFGDY